MVLSFYHLHYFQPQVYLVFASSIFLQNFHQLLNPGISSSTHTQHLHRALTHSTRTLGFTNMYLIPMHLTHTQQHPTSLPSTSIGDPHPAHRPGPTLSVCGPNEPSSSIPILPTTFLSIFLSCSQLLKLHHARSSSVTSQRIPQGCESGKKEMTFQQTPY